MRKDLLKISGWTSGSVLAQSGHIFCKLLVEHSQNPRLVSYLKDINNMTKVVLSVKNQSQLKLLQQEFLENLVVYSVWEEKPENQDVGLATVPYEPEEIRHLLKRCSLYS